MGIVTAGGKMGVRIEGDGDIEGEFMKWILHTRWG